MCQGSCPRARLSVACGARLCSPLLPLVGAWGARASPRPVALCAVGPHVGAAVLTLGLAGSGDTRGPAAFLEPRVCCPKRGLALRESWAEEQLPVGHQPPNSWAAPRGGAGPGGVPLLWGAPELRWCCSWHGLLSCSTWGCSFCPVWCVAPCCWDGAGWCWGDLLGGAASHCHPAHGASTPCWPHAALPGAWPFCAHCCAPPSPRDSPHHCPCRGVSPGPRGRGAGTLPSLHLASQGPWPSAICSGAGGRAVLTSCWSQGTCELRQRPGKSLR